VHGSRLPDGHPRIGYTFLELIIVLSIAAILLAIAIPRALNSLDRISARSAAGDIASILAAARSLALAGHSPVAVDIDSVSGVLRIRRGEEVISSRGVGSAHGVVLRRNRDSLTFDARGLGRGAANLSIIVRRRAAAETVFVSRLGRVR
jgi:prepilin-type N-terminal cleavage/methylation domain-containing protein